MNETNIHGVLEIYHLADAGKVSDIIGNMGDNFFNLAYSKNYENNKGSILIPFARTMRAEKDDLDFLESELNAIIKALDGIFLGIEVFLDTFYHGRLAYQIVSTEDGRLLWERFAVELKAI